MTNSIRLGMIEVPLPSGGGRGKDMADMKHENVLNRLKTAEGHLRGIQRMVEEDAYCIDIIRQIQAVQSALNKVSSILLENHLNTCLITAVRGEDPQERERVLREIVDVYEAMSKV